MSALDGTAGPRNWADIVISAFLGGAFIFLVTGYFRQDDKSVAYNNSVETRLHDVEIELVEQKSLTANMSEEIRKTETSIAGIEQSQALVQSTMQGVDDSVANIKETLNGHTAQLAAITDILRPVIVNHGGINH